MLAVVSSNTPPALGFGAICLRLLCAMVVGMVIGTEREYTRHPAGMRTHILVALGSCAVMLTGELIFAEYAPYGATPDPARLGAQVITGVGFLGAGTILREGSNVRGLTTAASIWAVACLGLAAGAGFYTVALMGMLFIFITLTIFELLQARFLRRQREPELFRVKTAALPTALASIQTASAQYRGDIRHMQVERLENGAFAVAFRAEFPGIGSKRRRQGFLQSLAAGEGVDALETEIEP